MAVVERKLHDQKELWFLYLVCKSNKFFAWRLTGELKQPRRRRQQKPEKFAYLRRKNSIFVRFARAFFIYWHFEDVARSCLTGELKQPRRRRQQKPEKFAYLRRKNSIFVRFARAFFIYSVTFWRRSRSCYDVKWPFLQLCERHEHMMTNCPKRWFQFISWIVKAHLSGIMTLNNWKMIAETRSDIFRWRSRFRRRRVCSSYLLINCLMNGQLAPAWQTIWLAIEGRHCMESAWWELISY